MSIVWTSEAEFFTVLSIVYVHNISYFVYFIIICLARNLRFSAKEVLKLLRSYAFINNEMIII